MTHTPHRINPALAGLIAATMAAGTQPRGLRIGHRLPDPVEPTDEEASEREQVARLLKAEAKRFRKAQKRAQLGSK